MSVHQVRVFLSLVLAALCLLTVSTSARSGLAIPPIAPTAAFNDPTTVPPPGNAGAHFSTEPHVAHHGQAPHTFMLSRNLLPADASTSIPAPAGLELLTSLGGAFRSFAISGTLGFVLEGPYFKTLNMSDQTHITEIGRLPVTGIDLQQVAQRVYVLTADGVQLIDVNNPQVPALVNTYAVKGGNALQASGNTIYVAGNLLDDMGQVTSSYLQIVDLSNPTQPNLLSTYTLVGQRINQLQVVQNRAYVLYENLDTQSPNPGGLDIMSVTDPAHPALLGTYLLTALPQQSPRLQVVNTTAYLLGCDVNEVCGPLDAIIFVLDFHDPSNPVVQSTTHISGHSSMLRVIGSTLYLAADAYIGTPDPSYLPTLSIYSVADSVNPKLITQYSPTSDVMSLAIMNSTPFLGEQNGIESLDVTNPTAIQSVRGLDTIGGFPFSKRVGIHLYLAGTGLANVDISDPTSPVVLQKLTWPETIYGFDVADNHAYVAFDYGLVIYDLNNLAGVPRVLHPGIPGFGFDGVYDVTVVGTWAYVLNADGWLLSVDLNTGNTYGGTIPTSNTASPVEMEAVGNNLYLPDGSIVNITDPMNLTLTGKLPVQTGLEGSIRGSVKVVNSLALVGVSFADLSSDPNQQFVSAAELQVFDVSNPSVPTFVGAYRPCHELVTTLGHGPDFSVEVVEVINNQVYINTCRGLQLVDISNPSQPRLAATIGGSVTTVMDTIAYNTDDALTTYQLRPDLYQTVTSVSTTGGNVSNYDSTVNLAFPTNAVTSTTIVTYTGLLTSTHPFDTGQVALKEFTLDATTSDGQPINHFAQAYTLTVSYTDADLAGLRVQAATLNLVYWNGSAWIPMLPCQGCGVDTAKHRVTAIANHFTDFALSDRQSESQYSLFLPFVWH